MNEQRCLVLRKKKNSHMIFKDYTTNTNMFRKCFFTNDDMKLQFDKWKKKLQKSFQACFLED